MYDEVIYVHVITDSVDFNFDWCTDRFNWGIISLRYINHVCENGSEVYRVVRNQGKGVTKSTEFGWLHLVLVLTKTARQTINELFMALSQNLDRIE